MKNLISYLLVVLIFAAFLWVPLYPALAQRPNAASRAAQIREDRGLPIAEQRKLLEENKLALEKRIMDFRIKLATKEAKLRERLANFKNKQNVERAQRGSETLNMINKNRTDSMTKHLELMSTILEKVEERAGKSATESASVQSAIASASASIATSKNAVTLQAQKDYTIAATSEASLRSELKTKRDLLHTDLTGVRKMVLDAKTALIAAIKATAQGKK